MEGNHVFACLDFDSKYIKGRDGLYLRAWFHRERLLKFTGLFFLVCLMSGCSSFSQVELGNSFHDKSDSKVVLMPVGDFPSRPLAIIAASLEEKHGFSVSTFTNMGVDGSMYNTARRQYVTNEIARGAGKILVSNGHQFCDKAVIVLTNKDINTADFRLRYVFSSHFHGACLSVISTARINPVNFGGSPNDRLVMDRLMKLINKAIGFHHYDLEVATNKESVMYGPIMSPMDLDEVGIWY